MIALLFAIGAWSPQSAWSIGPHHGLRVSTSTEVTIAGDRLPYRDFDFWTFGGRPHVAWHFGPRPQLEVSLGARAQLGWPLLGGAPLVIGGKYTLLDHENVAVALAATLIPFEIEMWSMSATAFGEAVVSTKINESWSFDAALGINTRVLFSQVHEVGPRARAGFTRNWEHSVFFISAQGGVDFNFVGAFRPAPFPYELVERYNMGLVVGYARR